MVNRNPFRIEVWSKTFVSRGLVGAPLSVTVNPRHNLQPTGKIVLPGNLPIVAELLADGARVTIDYHGEQVLSGPVRRRSGVSGPGTAITVEVDDDWRILSRILAWPNPTGAITAQGADDISFDKKTGPAETVVKWFVSRNATRLGLPVTVAPSLGRGDAISVQMRMQPLADELLPLLDPAGIGVSVRQVGGQLVVDCYEPAWYAHVLTERSGVVREWEWDQAGPGHTRVVVGGGGEAFNRDFRQYVSTSLEAAWGDEIEVFRDASDAYSDAGSAYDKYVAAKKDHADAVKEHTKAVQALSEANRRADLAANAIAQAAFTLTQYPGNSTATANRNSAQSRYDDATSDAASWTTKESDTYVDMTTAAAAETAALTAYNAARTAYLTELDIRGATTLAEGLPKSGLKLTLAETETFRYGDELRVGDLVTTELVPGSTPITDVLREAVISWTADEGLLVTPVVGERQDDPNKIFARALASVARAIRTDRARR